jgi:hypothetical protein
VDMPAGGGGRSVPEGGAAQGAPGAGGNVSATVSSLLAISSTTSTFITTWALALAAGAIVALLLIDRVKPSRTRRQAARARRQGAPLADVAVIEDPTEIYRRTPIWKRLASFLGLGVTSDVMGILLAMVIAIGAIAVLTLLANFS